MKNKTKTTAELQNFHANLSMLGGNVLPKVSLFGKWRISTLPIKLLTCLGSLSCTYLDASSAGSKLFPSA